MIIRHSILCKLFAYGENKEKFQIRMRVSFNAARFELGTGCVIYDKKYWDDESGFLKPGYKDKKGKTTIMVNNTIRKVTEVMETTFSYFETAEIYPTVLELKDNYRKRLKGSVPQPPTPSENIKKESKEPDFLKTYDEFIEQCTEKNSWTKATIEKMHAMRNDYMAFNKKLKFSDLTEKTLTEFVVYLRDKKKLNTPRKAKGNREAYDNDDLVGLKNSTIKKKLEYMKWFLNWATDKGYNTNLQYRQFKPSLKSTQKKVIYLNQSELEQVYNLNLTSEHSFL